MSAVLSYTSRRQENALVEALRQNDVPTVLELLDFAPHLAHRNENGQSLPLLAALHGATDVAEVLVRNGASLNIFAAAALGKVDHVECLLGLVPDLAREFNPDGWTALHLAAHFAHLSVAEVITSAGADIDAVSRNSLAQTPLHTAAAVDAAEVVDLLLSLGANPNVKTAEGCTPMHIAAHVGSQDIVEQLMHHGADPNAARNDSATPLMVALLADHWQVIRLLRERRAIRWA